MKVTISQEEGLHMGKCQKPHVEEMDVFKITSQLGGLGSAVGSPSDGWGGTLAADEFCTFLNEKKAFCTI